MNKDFKSGFVNIIGMPNAGKSTLYNALLGENLSIVNPKAQTTRHRILGIKNIQNAQIIFSDTPGILKKISYEMHKTMMGIVHESIDDADVLVLVYDSGNAFFEEGIKEKFNKFKGKKIFLLNKIDLLSQGALEVGLLNLKKEFEADVYLPISALNKFQLDIFEKYILDFLPIHPPYFDSEDITDRSERFFVNEMVRNNLLRLYDEEIPYAAEITTLQFKESEKIIRIHSEIVVERESQKGIIIGNKGLGIKNLGIKARKDLEEFFQKQVYLELFVKVRKDWRNNKTMLKQFGYDQGD